MNNAAITIARNGKCCRDNRMYINGNNTSSSFNHVGAALADGIGILLAVVLNAINFGFLTTTPTLFSRNLRMCLRLLSIVDILGGLLCYGNHMLFVLKPLVMSSKLIWCHSAMCSCNVFTLSSLMILLLITVDRYIAVTRPLRYNVIMNSRRIRILLASALVLGFTMGVLFGMHHALLGLCFYNKLLLQEPITAMYMIFPFTLLVVTTALNAHLLCIAHQHRKRIKDEFATGSIVKRYKSVVTVTVLVGSSYLVWLPPLVVTLVIALTGHSLSSAMGFIWSWVAFITHWLNPIILIALNKSYQRAVITFFNEQILTRKWKTNVEHELT